MRGKDRDVVIAKLKVALEPVPDVASVETQPKRTKVAQGNKGDHHQSINFAVYTKRSLVSGSNYLEFELTRKDHMKPGPHAKHFIVTACFKTPPPGLLSEAWRVWYRTCFADAVLPGLLIEHHKVAAA